MADQEVKLFGLGRSPFSNRVEIALKLKGVEYEYVEEDLSSKSPLLLKYNPVHKKIPVLLHNGNPIAESLVILEYIDETWKSGTPLLPKDPHQRATARFWAKFIDDKCFAALLKVMKSKGEKEEKTIEEIGEHLKTLDNELKTKKFFGGESIGLVDISANVIAFWFELILEAMGIELLAKEKYPNLSRWMDDYLDCSIINENLPPRAPLLALFQARFRPTSASE